MKDRLPRAVFAALLALAALLFLRCAWQSDDAYIAFRTAWNWVHGYGLRWNVDERVQSFTSPLWMALAAACLRLTGEVYVSTLALSAALATAALGLSAGISRDGSSRWVSMALLLASGALVDFAACGLENPAGYLLLSALLWLTLRSEASPTPRGMGGLWLLAALLSLARQDLLLLALPALLWETARARPRAKAVVAALLGLAPWVAWELFSILYYGYPFPNTAYAKLNLDIPRLELWGRGLAYLADSLRHDPATLLVAGVALGRALWRGRAAERAWAVGISLYLLYIVDIGGDFMSGRFVSWLPILAVPLLAPLWEPLRPRAKGLLALALLALGFALPGSRYRSGEEFGRGLSAAKKIRPGGIADERAYYYPSTGLWPVYSHREELLARDLPLPPSAGALRGLKLREEKPQPYVTPEAGFAGYFAGPELHLIDGWALSDPLLAHLRFEPRGSYRPGHYPRPIPPGYPESATRGTNSLAEPALAACYEDIRRITRAPLFAEGRWRAIARMNLHPSCPDAR